MSKSKIWHDRIDDNPIQIYTYPGGEVRLGPLRNHPSLVFALIRDSDGIMALAQLANIYRRHCVKGSKMPGLVLLYVPYGRQDRVAIGVEGNEAHALKEFARIINAMEWSSVSVYDPHSDVTAALIDRVQVIERVDLVSRMITLVDSLADGRQNMALVAPDTGAFKQTIKIAQTYRIPTVCVGEKVRNMETGEITGSTIYTPELLANKHVIIADDICDGGRTFTELGKVIRERANVASLNLYVTNGIFSKGKEVFAGIFDNVIAAVDWTNY